MADSISWRTESTATIYKHSLIELRRDTVELPNGTSAEFDYVDEPEAVVVLPVTSDDQVVTVSEWRQTVGRVVTGLPGGSIEAGEDPKQAARRELTEESGYTADDLSLMSTVEVNNGLSNGRHHHFVARECAKTGTPTGGPMESTEVAVNSLSNLVDAVASGEIADAKTVTGLSLYLLRESGDCPRAED